MVNITTPSFLKEGKYMCDLHQKWWETLWVTGGDKCPQLHWPGIQPFICPQLVGPSHQSPEQQNWQKHLHTGTALSTGAVSRQRH